MTLPSPAAPGDAGAASVPLRRNRDFVLLWSGQVVSTLGTRITSVAFPLLVLATTGSPTRAGGVVFAQTLPFLLLYLPAGALVDRWDRKRTMVGADIVRAVALGSVAVALVVGAPAYAHLLLAAFVEGAFFVFFQLAESAALPRIVPAHQLSTAVAQNEARLHGADLVGQPLGGVLFGVSRSLPFVVDAVSYAVSCVALLFVRGPLQESTVGAGPRTRLRTDIAEGVRFLWSLPFIRATAVLIGLSNFGFNALVLALIVRARDLGASPGVVGTMLGFYGAGGLIGALVAPAVVRTLGPRLVMIGATWLWVATTAALVMVGTPLLLGVVAGASSLAGPAFNVVVTRYRYQLVPDRLLGRVQSVARIVAWGSIPLGAITGGALVEAFGARTTFLLVAVVMAVVAGAVTVVPAMRRLPPLEAA